MNSENIVNGIHHITAIAGPVEENVTFYQKVLELRLVKQTVNFDDPSTYHLYYGDHEGNPGTILTFFPWQGIARGKNGAGMVTAIAFTIPRGSLEYWKEQLLKNHVESSNETRFGQKVIKFADPSGLTLELIEAMATTATQNYNNSSSMPKNKIIGFHSATATLRSLEVAKKLLVDTMGMELDVKENNRYRFKMKNSSSLGIFYDLLIDPKAEAGSQGSGSVHHIAFRTPDDNGQHLWRRILREADYNVTEIMDRKYFKSIYFREPGGVLFEIATDSPGFAVDESIEHLGESLQLPEIYEPMRSLIEKNLPPLTSNTFAHQYVEAERDDNELTLVPLHGTGGDEHDLIPLARQLGQGAAIISPRGRVKEGQWNRFFVRFPSGAFDEQDVIRQSQALAEFVLGAANRYNRSLNHLTALGYSNGANIAAATLLLRPDVFSKLILLRPMLPLMHPASVDLSDKQVVIIRGANDSVIPQHSTDQLIEVLLMNGARLDVHEIDAGHGLTSQDLQIASQWLASTARANFVA